MYSIGKNIGILDRQFNVYLNHELKSTDITAAEFMYIGFLYQKDGITQDELAKEFLVDRAAVTRTLQRMEEKGFITRQVCTDDKRGRRVYLTEKAFQYEKKAEEIQLRFVHAVGKDLSEEKQKEIEDTLTFMAELIKGLNMEALEEQEEDVLLHKSDRSRETYGG